MNTKTFLLFFIGITIVGCSGDTPDSYFGKTTLNVNRYFNFGKRDFTSMQQSQKQNMLIKLSDSEIGYTESYVEHIETYLIPLINEDIKKVKDLKPTTDTQELIDASLEVYTFIQQSYETDYMAIAKMMDAKESQNKIDAAIEQLQAEKASLLNDKKNKLYFIAKPFAEKNGINAEFR
ncbi:MULTISPECIES: hypothetical protein [Aquimarina]|uniref:hypothetical protein n=1 Tax=Aquimarina TaxID=290174 RepID=UPI000D68CFD7|nr:MULTISPECIES: hypothetical protein [Aquimarina]